MTGLVALPASTWCANSPAVAAFKISTAITLGTPISSAKAAPNRHERSVKAIPTATAAVTVVCLVQIASPHKTADSSTLRHPPSHWATTTPPTAHSKASMSTRAYPAHW